MEKKVRDKPNVKRKKKNTIKTQKVAIFIAKVDHSTSFSIIEIKYELSKANETLETPS